MRVAIAICAAVYAKLKQAPDWMRVIRDCGLHIVTVEDIQPTLDKINKKISLDYVQELLGQAKSFTGQKSKNEWDWK